MKDTPEIRLWVSDKIEKYYKQIGVNTLPKVFFKLEDAPHGFQCDHLAKSYKKYAAVSARSFSKKPHLILINLQYHKTYQELEDTIAHEMMHLRFPNLNHSDEYDPSQDFFTRLGQILQGKHYPKAVRKKK